MQREKNRVNGWFWVIAITLVLSSFIWVIKTQGHFLTVDPPLVSRTYAVSGASASLQFGEGRVNPASKIYDAQLIPPESTWLDYRSRSVSANLSPTLAPIARVELMAPASSMSMEEWQASLRSNRGTQERPWMQNHSSDHLVSSTRAIEEESADKSDLAKADPTFQSGLNGVWPVSEKLMSQLNDLNLMAGQAAMPQHLVSSETSEQNDSASQPSDQSSIAMLIAQSKQHLTRLSELGDCSAESLECIKTLDGIADQMLQLASQQSVMEVAESTARTAYSIKRRTQLWKGVAACLQQTDTPEQLAARNFSREELAKRIEKVLAEAVVTGDVPGWRTYLMIDDLELMANENTLHDRNIHTARLLLDRISWKGVTAAQSAFLTSASVRDLAIYIQGLAIQPIDYRKLLSDFETLENDSMHRCSMTIVSALQSLRYSENPNQLALSEAISTYYRNANVRVAISSDLINRFVPENAEASRPVHQNILGANTTGTGQVRSKLNVSLVPNKQAWQVKLQLNANVTSKTASEKWPAVVHSASNVDVVSSREITITPDQLNIAQDGPASVKSNDRVRNVETDFDGLPIVSDLVRFFVDQQLKEQRPIARKITQNLVKEETNREFDAQLNKQLQGVQEKLQQKVIQPLQFIGIDSDVVDLETTDTRLIGRYRIASYDALAANTPRPQAPTDSLFSIQVHQSAINNTFQQLKLGGRDWQIAELLAYLSERLHLKLDAEPDLPAAVVLRFEEQNPISVEFADNQILLALRIARLSEPGRLDLKHFIIRVTYAIDANGLNADLVRNGAISVDGERLGMRDRLPLRAIFGRVFAAHSRIQLVKPEVLADKRLEGLAVSQVVSREGWLAFAISPTHSPNVAQLQPNLTTSAR